MTNEHEPVAVIGLGRIGLALTGYYLDQGLTVVGCDIDAAHLRDLPGSVVARAEPGLSSALARGIEERRLRTTTDTGEAARAARTIVVIVPVHASSPQSIDTTALEDVARRIVPAVQPGAIVIIETTVPIGTTRRLFATPLVGRGVGVAFSPERVSVGRVFRDLHAYPKVVGGADSASAARAAAFYGRALGGADVRLVGSLETAEFVKLIETTYRYVNIALADEFALAAERHGIDVSIATEAANSQPYSHIHTPGLGVGGNCIPVYPFFFEAGSEAPLVRTARAIDAAMVEHVVDTLRSKLGTLREQRVLLLGVSYRAGVKDSANTPAVALSSRLEGEGARVSAVDPLFSGIEIEALGLHHGGIDVRYDAVVVVTPHPELLEPRVLEVLRPRLLIDGRNAMDPELVTAHGIEYVGIGRHRPA